MKTIRLYGELRKKFGREFKLDIHSVREATHALGCMIPGFRSYLTRNSSRGFHVIVGSEDIDKDNLENPVSQKEVIKIIPAIIGSGGIFKVIAGIALIAIGQPVLGAGLLISGAAEILFAPPTARGPDSREGPENKPSYVFDGVVNTTVQGNAVPLCYGKLLVGSQVVSAGLSAKQLK